MEQTKDETKRKAAGGGELQAPSQTQTVETIKT